MLAATAEYLRRSRRDRERKARGHHSYWMSRGYLAIRFEYATIECEFDKSTWGPGPWQDEPDRQRWQHAGIECLVMRVHATGSLCGYVGVRKGHPFWRKDYDDIPVRVHGGLTFGHQIASYYWIGFDCAHYLDTSPALDARLRELGQQRFVAMVGDGQTYRDLAYVTRETEQLAEQVAKAQA